MNHSGEKIGKKWIRVKIDQFGKNWKKSSSKNWTIREKIEQFGKNWKKNSGKNFKKREKKKRIRVKIQQFGKKLKGKKKGKTGEIFAKKWVKKVEK